MTAIHIGRNGPLRISELYCFWYSPIWTTELHVISRQTKTETRERDWTELTVQVVFVLFIGIVVFCQIKSSMTKLFILSFFVHYSGNVASSKSPWTRGWEKTGLVSSFMICDYRIQNLNMSEYGNLNFRAVDSFSNPGVFVVIDCVSLFLSSFLNLLIFGVLWHPMHPCYLRRWTFKE